jgi:hypothetical protein
MPSSARYRDIVKRWEAGYKIESQPSGGGAWSAESPTVEPTWDFNDKNYRVAVDSASITNVFINVLTVAPTVAGDNAIKHILDGPYATQGEADSAALIAAYPRTARLKHTWTNGAAQT